MNWLSYESIEGEIKRALQKFEELEIVGKDLVMGSVEVKAFEGVTGILARKSYKLRRLSL